MSLTPARSGGTSYEPVEEGAEERAGRLHRAGPAPADVLAGGAVAREPVHRIGGGRVLDRSLGGAASPGPVDFTAAPGVGFDVGAAFEWAVLAFAALAGVMMLWWPLGHDQGIFASNGAVVAAGGEPYRDAYETRGPLVFYLFAAFRLLFGAAAWGIRVVDLAVAVFTAALLGRVLAPFASRRVRRLTGAAWVLMVVTLGHKDSAQPDLWIATAVLGGTLLVTREAGYRRRDLVAFGWLIGLASLTKQVYPVLLAVAGVVVLWRRRGHAAGAARDLGLLTLGWAAPVAAMLAWFWARGGLGELWEAHMTYTLRIYPIYTGERQSRVVNTLVFFLHSPPMATALPAAALGSVALWRGRREVALAMAAWVATGLFEILLQGRFFPYHWVFLVPPLAVLAAVGCASALREPGVGRRLGVAVGLCLIAQVGLRPLIETEQWLEYLAGRKSTDVYYTRFSVGITSPAEEMAAARYLRAHSRPADRIGTWAMNPALPFLADRLNVNRFTTRRWFLLAPEHELTRRYRRQLFADVAGRRPLYFVVNRRTDPGLRPLEREFPELNALVADRYVHDTTFGGLEVLRLRGAAAAPRSPRDGPPPTPNDP